MTRSMSSRDRMLAALNSEIPDHVPLAFMIFTALGDRLRQQRRASDPVAQVEAQLELGIDAVVDLTTFAPLAAAIGHADAPGLPVRFAPQVRTAIETMGPGGLIPSPVDNVRDPSDGVWENALSLIAAWKRHRGGPLLDRTR